MAISRRSPNLYFIGAALVVQLVNSTAAQSQTSNAASTAPAPAPVPCTAAEFRQFDFWIGNWEVRDPSGKTVLGTNRIESILGGCALEEHWTSAQQGQMGNSFNKYFPPRKLWHQTWVDNSGGFLLLDGEFKDGVMTLRGSMANRSGATVLHRISWSRVDGNPDRVRQYWETSSDGGKTWASSFDGIYWRMS